MRTEIGDTNIYLGQASQDGDHLYVNGDNFGYLEDMLFLGYQENVLNYNFSGRTQVHYFSKTGTAAYPQIYVYIPGTGNIVYSGITSQRNSLTVIVPAGYSIYVQSGGTIYSWTCNYYNE